MILNRPNPIDTSSQEQQSDQGCSDAFTSSDNSESNLGDYDPSPESEHSRPTSAMNTNANYSFSPRTGGILTSPQLANNPFAVKTTTATKSIADSTENKEGRPIVAPATFTPRTMDLVRSNCSSSSFKLKPAVLANPFAKCDSVSERRNDCQEVSTSKESEWSDDSAQESSSSSSACINFTSGGNISSSFAQSNTNNNHQHENHYAEISRAPTVAPPPSPLLGSSRLASPAVSATSPTNINFVFGQKMNERVMNGCTNNQNTASSNGTPSLPTFNSSPEQPELEASGGSEEKLANGEPGESKSAKSLHESAQEYESRKVKRTYEEVLVVTGEEEESNVLQVNCKLFAFDKMTSSWLERGRGLLRLNDKDESAAKGALQSRLVMRTQGSLRVVLNTKVWAGMAIERPSPKSVRITAMDGEGGVKVFLIMASPKDAEQLHNALNWRVKTLKTLEEQSQQRFSSDLCSGVATTGAEDLNCQPSTTTSDDSSSSPKRRRVTAPNDQLDDSDSSEFGTNIQDTSIDSTSRNKNNTFEADSGNLSSSSL